MRKLLIGIAAVALLALLALPVMALTNPWNGCCDVEVEITIPAIAELYSILGTGQERANDDPPEVTVTNAGGIIPAEGIAEDTLVHCSNIDVDVSVTLQTDIPMWTRFHVIVAPTNRTFYNCVGAWPEGPHGASYTIVWPDADNIITWDRQDTGYVGNDPGNPVAAFTGSAGVAGVPHLVDYAVDAIHGMPAMGSMTPTVMWTIAASS